MPNTRRLHHPTHAALESDLKNLYFWHGVLVPALVVVRPDWITAKHVLTEENAEVRRVMIERMGHERFLLEANAQPVHQDEVGALYRIELPGDEPIVLVHVTNATPEPDGSLKKYVLRVNPELRPMFSDGRTGAPQVMTARNAVASTFGLTGEEWDPCIQT